MTKLSFTVPQVEKAIGIPAENWKGRCFEIASAMVRAKLVRGTAVYGHWTGPIASTSHFADRRHLGFTNHGWILVDESTQLVVDPTRWVFEDREPYIFIGAEVDIDDETWPYDEGGNKLRAVLSRPPPGFNPLGKSIRLEKYLSTEGRQLLALMLGESGKDRPRGVLSVDQMFWLANQPFDAFGEKVHEFYKAIKAVGRGALIPIDNLRRAERSRWR